MATKTFSTVFALAAKYTGKPAFAALNRDIDKTQLNLKSASTGFSKMFGSVGRVATAIGGAAAAYGALRKAQDFWRMGVEASKEAVDLQEKLGIAAERNAKLYRQSGAAITKSVNATSEAIAALGFDTEDVTAGVTQLLGSMKSTKQLQSFSQAFANITAKTHGAKPGMEGFRQSAEDINAAILRGKSPLFKKLQWDDKQIKAFKKLTQAQRYATLQQYGMNKLAKEAVRVMGTTPGKIAKAEKAYEDLGQAVAGGAVENLGNIAESQERLYKKLLPTAEAIGKKLAPAFERWAKLLEDNGPLIGKTITSITETLLRIPDAAVWATGILDKLPVVFDLPKHWPKIKTFFTDLWSNTQKELELVWPIISKFGEDLWANTLKEWEKLKEIVVWIDTNIIKPIANLFDWLVNHINAAWRSIDFSMTAPAGMGGEAYRRAVEGRTMQQRGSGYAPYQQRGTGGGAIPTTSYSTGARAGGPDEMQDTNTNRGYTASGKNLGRGAVAVNTKLYPLGTVFRDKKSGEAFVAADRHGNVNPKVVDVFENPANYKASLGKGRDLQVVGKLPAAAYGKGWKASPAKLQEALRPFQNVKGPASANTIPGGVKYKDQGIQPAPTSSMKGMLKGMNMRGRVEGSTATNVASLAPSITVNATSSQPELIARKVKRVVQNQSREFLAQARAARNHEARLGYV